jgi:hypothetical protein
MVPLAGGYGMGLVLACGQCKTPLDGPARPNAEDILACPGCGNSDTFENVQRIVGEFMKEHAAEQARDMLRGVARRSETFTFNEAPRPKGVYRFIAIDGH